MNNSGRIKTTVLPIVLCVAILLAFGQAYAEDILYGTIIETMNSGGYSYALIEKDGKKTWVAVPQTLLSVGDQVEFSAGMDMGQYTSKTLGKTFDSIIFSGGVVAIKKASKENKSVEAQVEKISVPKASGPDGYTIAELYEKKEDLAGKKVVVTGKVYKVSKFMGSTWIRMKDGTGSRKKGDHKLVVTSQESAEKDDIVTISGVMTVDKKIGGLSYEVVVEQAEVTKTNK